VGQDIIGKTTHIWGRTYSTDSRAVERDYDRFAETGSYDDTFETWGYVGPETAAAIMRNYVPTDSRVLDAACGSGLTGAAMARLGYRDIVGIDISTGLLAIAERTGAYHSLERVDMQAFPLPFDDGAFDAVCFIGALTYFETTEILRELCRVVRSGGYVVFSQRDDLMRERHYDAELRALEDDGTWQRVFGTEPMPYLPRHPEYGTDIQVQYFVYRVA
jgi:predicted TPR repeat methyltransferase